MQKLLLPALLLYAMLAGAQTLAPNFKFKEKPLTTPNYVYDTVVSRGGEKEIKKRGANTNFCDGEGESYKIGFIPFRSKCELKEVFSGNFFGKKNSSFNALQTAGLGLPFGDLNAIGTYVDILSFLPKISVGRVALGLQVAYSNGVGDTTANLENLSLQKIMNGGGSMILQFNRPLVFVPFYKSKNGFLNLNVATNASFDVPKMDQKIYNPGFAFQPSVDFDLQLFANTRDWIFSRRESNQVGNFCKIGIRGRTLFNLFNARYSARNDVDRRTNNMILITGTGYISLGPAQLDIGASWDNKKLLPENFTIRLSMQPVQF